MAADGRARKWVVAKSEAPQKIAEIQFSLMSPVEMKRVSEFMVWSQEMYRMPARRPAPNGVLDQRLGVADKLSTCLTCHKKVTECAGHFGHVEFQLPVFHIGFFKHTLTICQCVCKSCSAILLSSDDREQFLRKMRKPGIDALMKAAIFKKIIEKCKKCHRCPRCDAFNGSVKKVSNVHTLKLVHEKFKGKSADHNRAMLELSTKKAAQYNPEVSQHLHKACEDLSPVFVKDLFKRITDEDCELLWMNPLIGRPEHLLLSSILVPPVPIRPSVAMDTGAGSNEDDLTVKMQEILGVNNALREAFSKGATVKMMVVDWNFLQVQVAQYLNGEMPGLAKPIGEKQPIRGLCQRLKGKSGRFRGNLSGKRVDFSARTVISPDPNLRIDQVGVPERVAMIMTYPDRVSRYNLEAMRALVLNGPNKHPGANYIRSGAVTKSLLYGNRAEHAANLMIGDIVDRHMLDGDVVLFNRQPSLHKLSIMSHRAKVMPWRTFRFNESCCTPYNADFDGDEMNMHLPQTEEARAEASELMSTPRNIVTSRNGQPQVAATQDFLTAAYLITQKDVFFDKESFCRLVATLGDGDEHIDLPLPAILKPCRLWTGKQVTSLLVRPNRASRVLVNLELEERNYSGSGGPMCPKDGYVVYRNGEHLSGNLAKKALGGDSKKGLVYVLLKDHGYWESARCMNRVAKLCANFMHSRGFSIGIMDVSPSPAVAAAKNDLVAGGLRDAHTNISDFGKGCLALKPGCDAAQSLENELTGILSKVREAAGQMAMKTLPWTNAPRVMADCGSKGSPLNISQMIALLGQIAVDGKRIQDGFVNRTLPHFPPKSLAPAAKGFVANSFYSGLTATEFFFHTMAGREGLVDTAVKTAQTGYMARRLMKALEDLWFHYDTTVRNSEGVVVQFTYGTDGLDPTHMEGQDRPVDLKRVLKDILCTMSGTKEPVLSHTALRQRCAETLASKQFADLLPQAAKFHQELSSFIDGVAVELSRVCSALGVDLDVKPKGKGAAESARVRNTVVRGLGGVTATQLDEFFRRSHAKYLKSMVEPGEAIGALGAQSISEPGTQMTLKTFHFAGVASMNVTLGVPRLTEIINASKNISTPIITAQLVQSNNEYAARLVKAKIEKTTLGQICKSITEVYAPESCHITITLDLEAIEKLKLGIDAESIRERILKGLPGPTRPAVLRNLTEKHVFLHRSKGNKIRIRPPDTKERGSGLLMKTYFTMQALKAALPEIIVQGIPSVSRAVISSGKSGSFSLFVEGCGLAEVMGSPGIDGPKTVTNNILEVLDVLGIEAARTKISDEISYIMNAYGIHIDVRHLMLLSDVMTFKGEVLGITRFGVAKMRESVLMLASFEKTTDHLFDAAVHSRNDKIVGVSECIIMGIPIPLGTGLFKLVRDVDRDNHGVKSGGVTVQDQLQKQASDIFTL